MESFQIRNINLSWTQKDDHVGKETRGKAIQVESAAYITYWKYANGSIR